MATTITASNDSTKPSKKKKPNKNPETNFLININSYTKSNDLCAAMSLYDSHQHQNLRLNLQHYNSLLHLCSISAASASVETGPSRQSLAIDFGFRIFREMVSKNVTPNEATVTAVARLAAAKGDGGYAFELVRNMGESGIMPRLRTYDPALFCFCKKLEAVKAYEVEEHMGGNGVGLEEPEITALLKVSAEIGAVERVYGYLHKLRNTVRCISEETAKVIEDWFRSENACRAGVHNGNFSGGVDVNVIREVMQRNGGGWHGLGWIGEGKWVVKRGSVEESGRCCCCNKQLVCVDVDEDERERFARSVVGLAMEREVKGGFNKFHVSDKFWVCLILGLLFVDSCIKCTCCMTKIVG